MLQQLYVWFINLRRQEKGQDLTEYALLVALIAIIVVLAVAFFGTQVSTFFATLGATASGWLGG